MTNPAASARSSRLRPPVGPQRVLALAQLTNSVGDGAYYVTSALLHACRGADPARVGLGLTVAWAIGSLVGVPLGRLADRRGPRGTAVLLALATGAAVASFLVVRGFLPFVLAACAYASAPWGSGGPAGAAGRTGAAGRGADRAARPSSSRPSTPVWRWGPASAGSHCTPVHGTRISGCSRWTR